MSESPAPSRWRQLQHRIEGDIRRLRAHLLANQTYLLAQARTWLGRLIFWIAAIAVGVAAVAFALLTDEATHLFTHTARNYPWLPFVLTPLAAVGLLWATRRWFAGAEGSGIPQVVAEMKRPQELTAWRPLVSLKIAFGKVVLGVAAVGAGFSFGREGPTVQVGASLMAEAGRFLPATLRIQRYHLLVAGGAAGIAAAFNTPLAGIIFAIEELSRSIESRMSGVVITAIVLSGVVAQYWMGNHTYFGQVPIFGETTELAATILACALFTGIAGGIFSRMLLTSATNWRGPLADFRARFPYRFAFLAGLLIAALGWATGGATWCSGYEETRALLQEHEALPWYYGGAKFIATVVAYLTGLPGGIFAPSLAIGAGLGQNLSAALYGQAYPTTVIVLCMVGFLAAVTQAPITSFIIVMEMVSGYPLVFGLMTTALLASAISRMVSKPLYATLADHMVARQQQTASASP